MVSDCVVSNSSVGSMLEWSVGGGDVIDVDGLMGLAEVFETTLGS